jgi:hypothetical protein
VSLELASSSSHLVSSHLISSLTLSLSQPLSSDFSIFRSDSQAIFTSLQAIEARNQFIFIFLCFLNLINILLLCSYAILQEWTTLFPLYCHIILITTVGYYLGYPPHVSALYLEMMNRGLKQFGLSVHCLEGKFLLKAHSKPQSTKQ